MRLLSFVSRRALMSFFAASFAVSTWAQHAPNPNSSAPLPPIQLALIEGLSGPFANTGEAVVRNIAWAVERLNARGGVKTAQGMRRMVLTRFDSKGQSEEALSSLKAALDNGAQFVLQGNSSANAAALIDAINKHNERQPTQQVLFLNYSAVDPALTNENCSFWHFRFDAHADMRMAALMEVLREDQSVKSAYLIGQDYSFGQSVLREARRQLGLQRPDVLIVGDELHPMGRVKDFLPYAAKIKASGAQAVITGNWGNDLTLLVKSAREAGYEGKFYTFYGNALGAPAAIGEAGLGRVFSVTDWLPNVPGPASVQFYQDFRQRFPRPSEDYVHLRMHLMIEALAQAIEKAGVTEPRAVALQLEKANVTMAGHTGTMRAQDHQFQQPLVVGVMARQGEPGVPFDVEGTGYGFKVVRQIRAEQAQMPSTCQMVRPAQ